jgi:hypothetical protein
MATIVTTISKNVSFHCDAVSHTGEVCGDAFVAVTICLLPSGSFLLIGMLLFCDISISHLYDIRLK